MIENNAHIEVINKLREIKARVDDNPVEFTVNGATAESQNDFIEMVGLMQQLTQSILDGSLVLSPKDKDLDDISHIVGHDPKMVNQFMREAWKHVADAVDRILNKQPDRFHNADFANALAIEFMAMCNGDSDTYKPPVMTKYAADFYGVVSTALFEKARDVAIYMKDYKFRTYSDKELTRKLYTDKIGRIQSVDVLKLAGFMFEGSPVSHKPKF